MICSPDVHLIARVMGGSAVQEVHVGRMPVQSATSFLLRGRRAQVRRKAAEVLLRQRRLMLQEVHCLKKELCPGCVPNRPLLYIHHRCDLEVYLSFDTLCQIRMERVCEMPTSNTLPSGCATDNLKDW